MLLTSGDTALRLRHTAVQRLTPHFVFASSGFVSWLPRPTLQTSDQVESYSGTSLTVPVHCKRDELLSYW